jgi:hypothetical protein
MNTTQRLQKVNQYILKRLNFLLNTVLKVQENLWSTLAGVIASKEKIDSKRKGVPVQNRVGRRYHIVVFNVKIILHFYRQDKCNLF